MKKKELLELGLTEELAGKVEASHNEELKGYIPKARFDEVNDEKKTFKEALKERDNQLEELKKSTDVEGMKKQIGELQAANVKKDEEHAAELKALKIDAAIDAALTAAKAKNLKAVKALLDLDGADFDKDGNIKGLSEQVKKLSEAEDSGFLFEVADTGKKPPVKGAKPAESKHEKPDGKVDFSKMTLEELTAYMENNPGVEIPENYN